MKLQQFGFEIYAAIDAYSRFIIWIFCGISATTSVSVTKQFIVVVRNKKTQPVIIRSDRGSETVLITEAHFQLSKAKAEYIHSDGQPVDFQDIWQYGRGVENIRIEAWWNKLIAGQLYLWRVSNRLFI